jgi:N-acyl-D-amino-acid deacylase
MEGVEDIPGSALAEGLKWSWESFPQYLDAIAAMPRTIDVLAQVPHDALRVFVMGDRAVAHGVATDDDIARMRDHRARGPATPAPRASPPGARTTTAR